MTLCWWVRRMPVKTQRSWMALQEAGKRGAELRQRLRCGGQVCVLPGGEKQEACARLVLSRTGSSLCGRYSGLSHWSWVGWLDGACRCMMQAQAATGRAGWEGQGDCPCSRSSATATRICTRVFTPRKQCPTAITAEDSGRRAIGTPMSLCAQCCTMTALGALIGA